MGRNPIVTVDNVSMKFNLSSEKFDSFKEYVIKSIKRQVSYDAFMALQGVSFEVMRWTGRIKRKRKKYNAQSDCRSVKTDGRKSDGQWNDRTIDRTWSGI